MPLEACLDQPLDAISCQFFEIDVDGLCGLFTTGAPLETCWCARRRILDTLGLPVARGHRLDPGLSVVALDPADGHERPEGIQQVLGEDGPGDQAAEPVDASPVVVGVWAYRFEAVVTGELAEVQAGLEL